MNHEGADPVGRLAQANATVDRVVAEFSEDLAIFKELERELRAYLDRATHQAKSAPAPVWTKAQAQMAAMEALLERTVGTAVPDAVFSFLASPWQQRLIVLGQSEGSSGPGWRTAGDLADRLLALTQRPDASGRAWAQLRAEFEAWFGVLGPTLTHHWQALGPLAGAVAPPIAAPRPFAPLPQAQPDRAAIAQLKLGDWVRWTDDKGRSHRLKLSWVSPISSRWMFVNAQGQRLLVASIDELFQNAKDGRLALHV